MRSADFLRLLAATKGSVSASEAYAKVDIGTTVPMSSNVDKATDKAPRYFPLPFMVPTIGIHWSSLSRGPLCVSRARVISFMISEACLRMFSGPSRSACKSCRRACAAFPA